MRPFSKMVLLGFVVVLVASSMAFATTNVKAAYSSGVDEIIMTAYTKPELGLLAVGKGEIDVFWHPVG
ncbi:MAG TPA: hypothetical protein ENJ59_02845, partial [Thermofilum sp.]|nr:hypothetical protein [Thermofilum sp.]